MVIVAKAVVSFLGGRIEPIVWDLPRWPSLSWTLLGFMRTIELSALRDMAEQLRAKQHRSRSTRKSHCREQLDLEFPFLIRAFKTRNDSFPPKISKVERLALMMPIDGPLRIHIRGRDVQLAPGEILIAENPIVRVPVDARHGNICVVVISFLPGFVYSLGSPSHDYFFLLPFYASRDVEAPIVREDSSLHEMHRVIARLIQCYVDRMSYFELGCKAFFLELLYYVARDFHATDILQSEAILEKERRARLEPVLAFVDRNYARLITLKGAASLAKMSVAQFVKLFKRVARMSFISYLTHVRLSHALRLLKESSLTIAAIAKEVGFSDQSYFDRRFKAAFGRTPGDFRRHWS